MYCILLSENLLRALSLIGKLPSKRSLPILENVLIEAKNGRIHFTITNLETGTKTSIGGKVEKEGSITVSLRLFNEFINTVKTNKIELKTEKETLFVKSETSKASFTTIPASEFPPFPQKRSTAFKIPQTAIDSIATQISYSASNDEGRPILTGIKLKPIEGKLIVAATDGFRLSVREFKSLFGSQSESVIPARTIVEVSRVASEISKDNSLKIDVSYTKDKNQLIFTIDDVQIFTRLIEGEYPNFEKIIPETSTTQVTVERDAFQRAIKAASIFARESANIVRIEIKKGCLVISSNTPQIGEEKTEVSATVSGEDNEIAFNFRFLIDFINSFSDDDIYFQMTNALSPGLFRPAKDTAYTHIIMPVRVQG